MKNALALTSVAFFPPNGQETKVLEKLYSLWSSERLLQNQGSPSRIKVSPQKGDSVVWPLSWDLGDHNSISHCTNHLLHDPGKSLHSRFTKTPSCLAYKSYSQIWVPCALHTKERHLDVIQSSQTAKPANSNHIWHLRVHLHTYVRLGCTACNLALAVGVSGRCSQLSSFF